MKKKLKNNNPDIREVQDFLLDMMVDLDKVLTKNNIDYMLFCGSALGAIRHGGFIPWDDDMDIAVDRENYYKLIEAFKKDLPEEYTFQCYETDKRYLVTYPAMKIRKKDSYIKEKNFQLCNKCLDSDGVFIDVFILEKVSNNKFIDVPFRLFNTILGYLIFILENININPIPLKSLFIGNCKLYEKINKNSDYIAEDLSWIFQSVLHPWRTKIENVFPTKRVNFEGHMFPIPEKYDEYLTSYFGNYMEYPPEDKRVGAHVYKVDLKDAHKDEKYKRNVIIQNIIKVITSILYITIIVFLIKGYNVLWLSLITVFFVILSFIFRIKK